MYTLLVGRPPFETPEVQETYKKIRNVNYKFPSDETRRKFGLAELSYEAIDLITMIL